MAERNGQRGGRHSLRHLRSTRASLHHRRSRGIGRPRVSSVRTSEKAYIFDDVVVRGRG